jgi:hypothetical protein
MITYIPQNVPAGSCRFPQVPALLCIYKELNDCELKDCELVSEITEYRACFAAKNIWDHINLF